MKTNDAMSWIVLAALLYGLPKATPVSPAILPVPGVYGIHETHDDPPNYSQYMSPINDPTVLAGATGASASVFQAAATITFTGGTQVVTAA